MPQQKRRAVPTRAPLPRSSRHIVLSTDHGRHPMGLSTHLQCVRWREVICLGVFRRIWQSTRTATRSRAGMEQTSYRRFHLLCAALVIIAAGLDAIAAGLHVAPAAGMIPALIQEQPAASGAAAFAHQR